MPNKLIDQTSPYLLQHAHNPVNWHPWGEEALARAQSEDKPIFLSIGYSACHWCHVMERESFEDAQTAEMLNREFVSIKVDREERPDLDSIYMEAVVAMTGQGGWPMSVFLSPDGVPFFGGTYFPPERRHQMPSFREVLQAIGDAYKHRRDQVLRAGASLVESLEQGQTAPATGKPSIRGLSLAKDAVASSFDGVHGGWGGAPKFPQPMTIEFLLRCTARTGDARALEMARKTLKKMARGGIYDHLGGGFHRYATDAIWLVPHFEKMLYDNSQLARVYLKAWQLTSEPLFRQVVEETLDFVIREMTDPQGGFYSTLDADSEGEEGRYYVWTPVEVREALGDGADLFMRAYDVSLGGNFEGKSIFNRRLDPDVVAHTARIPMNECEASLAKSRQLLLAARERRVRPGLDGKVVTSWNGLMLAAFADAGKALGDARYLDCARRNAAFLLAELRSPEGRLYRTWKGGRASLNGYLEDYSFLIEGLLALYEATFEDRWFAAARDLADAMIAHFSDPNGGFFDTSDDHERLITRPKSVQDNALPSGGAMAATVLLRLAALTGDGGYARAAEAAIDGLAGRMERIPVAFAQWLNALDFQLGDRREVAIIGDAARPETRELLDVVRDGFRPNLVTAAGPPVDVATVPLLSARPQLDGRATAYVCRNFVCDLPVTEPDDLRRLLAARA